jgi:hypothetical protein
MNLIPLLHPSRDNGELDSLLICIDADKAPLGQRCNGVLASVCVAALAAWAQRGIEPLAGQNAAMLALGRVAARPERQPTGWGIVLAKRRQYMLAIDAAILRPQTRAVTSQLIVLKRDLVGTAGVAGAHHQITAALRVARYNHQASAGRLKLFDSHGGACRSYDRMCTRRHCFTLLLFMNEVVAWYSLG